MSNAKPSGSPAGAKGHSIIIRLHSSRHPPPFRRDYYCASGPPSPSIDEWKDAARSVKSSDSIAKVLPIPSKASEGQEEESSFNLSLPSRFGKYRPVRGPREVD